MTDTQTKTIFHQHNTSYNTGVAVQDNAAQQWWYSTILTANTISNTGKFAKMVHLDFFGEDGGRSSHHSHLENQWLQVVDYDEDTFFSIFYFTSIVIVYNSCTVQNNILIKINGMVYSYMVELSEATNIASEIN